MNLFYDIIIEKRVILMNEIKEHIVNKEWMNDPKEDIFFKYYKIAQKCSKSKSVKDLVSGTLLYNQLVEKSLKDTIIISIIVIKAKSWPEEVELDLNFDRATFGKLVEYFKKFALKKYNRDIIIKYLNDILPIRNKVIHKIFDIEDINKELVDYFGKADELVLLLNGYYNAIAENILYDLEEFDFNNLI